MEYMVQHCGGYSILWGIVSVLWMDSISTVEGEHQYYGGIASVLRRDSISTAEAVQYPSVLNRCFTG